jgi:hypothetical protein
VYTALARAVLDETDRERVAEEVRRLRRRHPKASRDELAGRLIRKAALRCAAASGILTGPAAFFGAMPFGADLAYQAVALNRLVLSLAALYGHAPSGRDRAAGIGAGAGAGVASELLRQGVVHLLRRAFPRRPGLRTVAGALVGGALGYGAAMAIGRFAQDVFRGRHRLRLPLRWTP